MRATTGLLDMGLREYFDTSVREAMSHQKVEATGETVVYLVGMMAGFVEAERVSVTTDDGVVLQPLTGLYPASYTHLTLPSKRSVYISYLPLPFQINKLE